MIKVPRKEYTFNIVKDQLKEYRQVDERGSKPKNIHE